MDVVDTMTMQKVAQLIVNRQGFGNQRSTRPHSAHERILGLGVMRSQLEMERVARFPQFLESFIVDLARAFPADAEDIPGILLRLVVHQSVEQGF